VTCSLEAQRKYSNMRSMKSINMMNFKLAHHIKNNDENQSIKRETCLQSESENKLRDDGAVRNCTDLIHITSHTSA
jgi:hypothetical protein